MTIKLLDCKSARWGFTFVTPSGLGVTPETQWNNALVMIDSLLSRKVLSFTTTAPPGSPTEGDMYFIPASPTGAWSGSAYKLAIYVDDDWAISNEVVLTGAVFWDNTTSRFVLVQMTGNLFELHDERLSPTNVAVLTQSISNPPTQAEVEAIRDKLIEVANALDDIDILNAI